MPHLLYVRLRYLRVVLEDAVLFVQHKPTHEVAVLDRLLGTLEDDVLHMERGTFLVFVSLLCANLAVFFQENGSPHIP